MENLEEAGTPTPQSSQPQQIGTFISMGCFGAYYIWLLYLHFSRRKLFPISERSYLLTLINGICSMLFVQNLILSCYLNYDINFLSSPNSYYYCGVDNYVLERTFSQSQKYLTYIMSFANNFLKLLEISTYQVRTLRICYIFAINLSHIKQIDSQIRSSKHLLSNNNHNNSHLKQNNNQNNTDSHQISKFQPQQNNENINVQTYADSEFSELNNQNLSSNNPLTQQQQISQQKDNKRIELEQSLMYSQLSFSNENSSSPMTGKIYWLMKNELILLSICVLVSIGLASLFLIDQSSSPFLFWNTRFGKEGDIIQVYKIDNYLFILSYFILVFTTLLCLYLIHQVEDDYRLKEEIYIIILIFFAFGNAIQFECSPYDNDSENQILGMFPWRLVVSGILDFIAFNIVVLRPIILAKSDRPWYQDNVVQNNIGFFCTKYRNFQDYLFSLEFSSRKSNYEDKVPHSLFPQFHNSQQSKAYKELVCSNMIAILSLTLEIKSGYRQNNKNEIDDEQYQKMLQNIQQIFTEYSELITIFKQQQLDLSDLFNLDKEEKVISLKNISISTTLKIIIELSSITSGLISYYQQAFKQTHQYHLLHLKYQVQNQISITFQAFRMTGE